MSDIIFLRVGNKDRITLKDFINSLESFLLTLKDFDATISDNSRGSMSWEVVSLEKKSPPVVGVAAYLRNRKLKDVSGIVEEQLIENAHLLSSIGDRNKYMSDAALANIEKMAKLTPKIGPLAVYIDGTGEVKAKADITEETLNNVKRLTGVRYTAYGSIAGSLDSINVHRGSEFRVWDERTKKPVRCTFDDKDLAAVKDLLKERVVVYGKLNSNSAGLPISIMADEFEAVPKRHLPTIEEMSGLVEDFTEGMSLKEYMEILSNG